MNEEPKRVKNGYCYSRDPRTSTIELLSRLDGVKQTGRNKWKAKCPAHDDNSPSLHIRECDDGIFAAS